MLTFSNTIAKTHLKKSKRRKEANVCWVTILQYNPNNSIFINLYQPSKQWKWYSLYWHPPATPHKRFRLWKWVLKGLEGGKFHFLDAKHLVADLFTHSVCSIMHPHFFGSSVTPSAGSTHLQFFLTPLEMFRIQFWLSYPEGNRWWRRWACLRRGGRGSNGGSRGPGPSCRTECNAGTIL